MLNKHPDTLTDSEIYEMIESLVRNKTPESVSLDYKKTLNFYIEREKIEVAKDITSFANTIGGCCIYGIDEERADKKSAPIPKENYGIDPIEVDLLDLENVLSHIVSPPLPDLRIRQISLPSVHNKVVYLLWHSKSWVAPHMVSGFKHARYYKRGNFKTEPMEEHEIEALYHAKSLSHNRCKEIIKSLDYGLDNIIHSAYVIKFIFSPYYLIPTIKYFTYTNASDFINTERKGHLISFSDGVAYISNTRVFIVKAFFNGVFTISYDFQSSLVEKNIDNHIFNVTQTENLRKHLQRTIMPFITHFYKKIKFSGPTLINMSGNAHNFILDFPDDKLVEIKERLGTFSIGDLLWRDSQFEIEEVFHINDILADQDRIIDILLGKFIHSYGGYNYNL
jgi:hypothetical protein